MPGTVLGIVPVVCAQKRGQKRVGDGHQVALSTAPPYVRPFPTPPRPPTWSDLLRIWKEGGAQVVHSAAQAPAQRAHRRRPLRPVLWLQGTQAFAIPGVLLHVLACMVGTGTLGGGESQACREVHAEMQTSCNT